jgi:hypothetical protein
MDSLAADSVETQRLLQQADPGQAADAEARHLACCLDGRRSRP